ncbi:hypothetical protein [Kistimonas asteriae]|uniref:hypothetical protein n=1 Tax=Kistimonas asteriae TaxID=517724 RepID=UPI001BA6ACF6|nr:hypothetical protein [Kistimonas asteriae]
MERADSSSSLQAGMQGPLSGPGKDSARGYPHRTTDSEPHLSGSGGYKLPTEPKPLCGRVVTYICIPVVFLVGTVVTPIIELGLAFNGLMGSVCVSLIFCCCAPCVMIPAIFVFVVDVVGGVGHGLATGGYRLVKKTLDPDNYSYFDGSYPSLTEKYQKACKECSDEMKGHSYS